VVQAAQTVGAHDFILRSRTATKRSSTSAARASRSPATARRLARALLADPRILILDEATSSVDIGTERKIERALRSCSPGERPSSSPTVVHDSRRDLIVRARTRPIVEQGTHDELLDSASLHVALRRLGC